MCLIIHKEAKQELSNEFIRDVFSFNGDGWGVFYYAGGLLQVEKGLTLESFFKELPKFAKKEAMIHFRFATHGEKTLEMAHPFPITNDIWMMHNGILSGKDYQCPAGKKSDTALFAELVRDILNMTTEPNEFIRSEKFKTLIMPEVGSNSIVFADNKGFILMPGALDSETKNGMKVSNSYAYTVDNPDSWRSRTHTPYHGGWHTGKDDWYDDPNYKDYGKAKPAWWELDDFIDSIEHLSYEEIVKAIDDDPYLIADVLIELQRQVEELRKPAKPVTKRYANAY